MAKTALLALLTLALATDASAQTRTYYDKGGNVTGKSSTDSQGTTTFYDASGKVTGRRRRIPAARSRPTMRAVAPSGGSTRVANWTQAMKNKRARRSPNYDRRLTRPIQLADGTRLKTLKDAADFFGNQFSTVTRWGPLEIATEMLIAAGQTGKRRTSRPRPNRWRSCCASGGCFEREAQRDCVERRIGGLVMFERRH